MSSARITVTVVLLNFLLVPMAAAQTLNVGLFRKAPPAAIRVVGPCALDVGGSDPMRLGSGASITIRCSDGRLSLGGAVSSSMCSSVRLTPTDRKGVVDLVYYGSRRPYRGVITIRPSRGKLLLVNRVDVEDYVRSVLPGEMPHAWPAQALAAQAVVARTFAVSQKGRHAREGFDLCDLTHCQVYRGASWERRETDRAVAMTAGLALANEGKPIPAPFHSTCGGQTTDGLYDGHAEEHFLQPVTDGRGGKAYCADSIHSKWSCRLSSGDLKKALESDGLRLSGDITIVRVLRRDRSGRAADIELQCGKRVPISACHLMMAVGRHLGWNKIKSTLLQVRKVGDSFVFTGKGLGHGMGLCQWGARGMAGQGFSCREILAHYFPRCRFLVNSR